MSVVCTMYIIYIHGQVALKKPPELPLACIQQQQFEMQHKKPRLAFLEFTVELYGIQTMFMCV